jgi:hypothetical protein
MGDELDQLLFEQVVPGRQRQRRLRFVLVVMSALSRRLVVVLSQDV